MFFNKYINKINTSMESNSSVVYASFGSHFEINEDDKDKIQLSYTWDYEYEQNEENQKKLNYLLSVFNDIDKNSHERRYDYKYG